MIRLLFLTALCWTGLISLDHHDDVINILPGQEGVLIDFDTSFQVSIDYHPAPNAFDYYFEEMLLPYEGGISSDINDRQSRCVEPGQPHTNRGLGICTAKWLYHSNKTRWSRLDKDKDGAITSLDVVKWTSFDSRRVAYNEFWKYMGAQWVVDPSTAALMCDWAWASGPTTAASMIRKIADTDLGVCLNQKRGDKRLTKSEIEAINSLDPDLVYGTLLKRRKEHLRRISLNKRNSTFIKGWLDRVNSIHGVMSVLKPLEKIAKDEKQG